MRKLFAIFAAVAMCLAGPSATSKQPTVHVIHRDGGGVLFHYIEKYYVWNTNGDRVRVAGECYSACTLVLGALDNRRICAARGAQFGFHSASNSGEFTQGGTEFMWSFYSGQVREVLARHGWAAPSYHPEFLMINAQEIVRPCE